MAAESILGQRVVRERVSADGGLFVPSKGQKALLDTATASPSGRVCPPMQFLWRIATIGCEGKMAYELGPQ